MQKYSKQNLTIAILAIVLVASMALTITFAAFANTASISGEIQFEKGVILQFTNNNDSKTSTVVGDDNSFNISTSLKYKLSDESSPNKTQFVKAQNQVSPKIGLATGSNSKALTITITTADIGTELDSYSLISSEDEQINSVKQFALKTSYTQAVVTVDENTYPVFKKVDDGSFWAYDSENNSVFACEKDTQNVFSKIENSPTVIVTNAPSLALGYVPVREAYIYEATITTNVLNAGESIELFSLIEDVIVDDAVLLDFVSNPNNALGITFAVSLAN